MVRRFATPPSTKRPPCKPPKRRAAAPKKPRAAPRRKPSASPRKPKAADDARKKAEDARKRAEAAEERPNQNQADQDAAAKLRAQANTDELDALKKEATAHLRTKEETLADSKLDDVRQRRAGERAVAGDPRRETEVDAAHKTRAGRTPGRRPGHRPAAPQRGHPAAARKAENAAKPVFDAQARGLGGRRSRRPR